LPARRLLVSPTIHKAREYAEVLMAKLGSHLLNLVLFGSQARGNRVSAVPPL
jgi:hypothetical protein